MTVLGCDVSLWQDEDSTPIMMDFNKSRHNGIGFVFIKTSQSTWCDPDYTMNWYNAKTAGLPRGGYHYMSWDTSAADQARFFWGMLKADHGELSPVLDYECRKNVPTRATALKAFHEFINTFEALSPHKLMIYTSPGFWNEYGSATDIFAKDRLLWEANYYVGAPAPIPPWTNGCIVWQKTDKGDGIKYGAESKTLDLNDFMGDAVRFKATFGVDPATPTAPVPQPPPVLPQRVKMLTNVRVRSTPEEQANLANVLGQAYTNSVWYVDGFSTDALGRVWYSLANEHAYVASWVTVAVP